MSSIKAVVVSTEEPEKSIACELDFLNFVYFLEKLIELPGIPKPDDMDNAAKYTIKMDIFDGGATEAQSYFDGNLKDFYMRVLPLVADAEKVIHSIFSFISTLSLYSKIQGVLFNILCEGEEAPKSFSLINKYANFNETSAKLLTSVAENHIVAFKDELKAKHGIDITTLKSKIWLPGSNT